MKNEDAVALVDEHGNRKDLKIYFAYHSERFARDYVIFYDPEDPDQLLAGYADAEGNLSDIESDEEYDELDGVIEEFQENQK